MSKLKVVLEFLDSLERDDVGDAWVDGKKIKEKTGLSEIDINDVIGIADNRGYVEVQKSMGTAPYKFSHVTITAEGRLWLETTS